MKLKTYFLTAIALLLLLPVVLKAQGAASAIPGDFLSKDIKDWQLNGLTLIVLVKIAGEGFSAIRNGGGLRRILLSIWFGENVPKPIAADYSAELANKNTASSKSGQT